MIKELVDLLVGSGLSSAAGQKYDVTVYNKASQQTNPD